MPLRLLSISLTSLLLLGCFVFRSAKTPMGSLRVASRSVGTPEQEGDPAPRDPAPTKKHLAVFLPGLGDSPRTLQKERIAEQLQEADNFDIIFADAHLGYYRNFTVLDRLHQDIISPIREQYDELWLIGISMGGYGAVAYAEKFGREVTGLVLLAPYLGQKKVIKDIEGATSLLEWRPDEFEAKNTRTQHGVKLWTWLRDRKDRPDAPIIYFGTGTEDRHMRYLRLLRPVLPPDRILLRPGGHDWEVWRPLFEQAYELELKTR